jgi:hypothetical protein
MAGEKSMQVYLRTVSLMAASAIAMAVSSAVAMAGGGEPAELKPGKGFSMDVGPKHTMSYFEPKDGGCGLTVVVAAKDGASAGPEAVGTRFAVTVLKGTSLRIDTSDLHSAEFECAPEGDHMHAKLFVREAHPKGKTP